MGRKSWIAVIAIVVLVVGAVGAAFAYDSSHKTKSPKASRSAGRGRRPDRSRGRGELRHELLGPLRETLGPLDGQTWGLQGRS